MHEQINKMNRDIMQLWDKMYSDMMMPWMGEWQSNWEDSWKRWFETFRSGYEMSVSNWNRMMEQSLGLYFKSYQKSKDYREVFENQLKQSWESVKETQQTQEQKTKEFLGNIKEIISQEERKMEHASQEFRTQ